MIASVRGLAHAERNVAKKCGLLLARCFTMAALPLGGALAQAAPVTACDILTAHPDDANRVAEPVPWNERDAARAIPACEDAVRKYPNQPRLRYQLGLAYDSGSRFSDSFSNYRQAANADYTAAGFALGWAYANGQGSPRDDAAAIRWYQWAADRGHSAAQNTLGFMYENGRGVPASLPQAADLYRRAHEQGRPIASANYGRMLALGYGGPLGTASALRRTLAVTVLRQAVQQERPEAALQLALMAERGEVQIDRRELIHLWAFAEAQSSERERARRSLQRLAAQGATAEVDQARAVIASRQFRVEEERKAAKRRQEAALVQLTTPTVPTPTAPIAIGVQTSNATGRLTLSYPSQSADPERSTIKNVEEIFNHYVIKKFNVLQVLIEKAPARPIFWVAGVFLGLSGFAILIFRFGMRKRGVSPGNRVRQEPEVRIAKRTNQSSDIPNLGVHLEPIHSTTEIARSEAAIGSGNPQTATFIAMPMDGAARKVSESNYDIKSDLAQTQNSEIAVTIPRDSQTEDNGCIQGPDTSAAALELSQFASAGRIPLLDLIRLREDVEIQSTLIAFGSVAELVDNVEWCRAHKEWSYEISKDAEVDAVNAKILASIIKLSRAEGVTVKISADAEGLRGLWKERKFINAYVITGQNRVSSNHALLIGNFGAVQLQGEASLVVYGGFRDLLQCYRDKAVRLIATGYELIGHNTVTAGEYADVRQLPGFCMAENSTLQQKAVNLLDFRHSEFRTKVPMVKITLLAVAVVFGGWVLLELVVDNRTPREKNIEFLQWVIRDGCAIGRSEFMSRQWQLQTEADHYKQRNPQSYRSWHSDEWSNLFGRAYDACR